MLHGVPVHREIFFFFFKQRFLNPPVNWSSQLKNPTLMLMSTKLPQRSDCPFYEKSSRGLIGSWVHGNVSSHPPLPIPNVRMGLTFQVFDDSP